MRIAIVSPYDLGVPGGVQAHVRLLAAALRRAGEQVVVVGAGAPAVDAEAQEVTVGATRGIPFNGSVAPVAVHPAAVRATRRVLRSLAPDVVHVHEPLVPGVGIAAATLDGPARVLTFHTRSDRSRAYRALRPLGRRLLDAAGVAIAVSPAAVGFHAAALGVPTARFQVVPNGVDVDRFSAAAHALGSRRRPGPPRLVFVGRLEPRKGALVLARAYLEVLERHPDVELTVVGDGPQRGELEALLSPVPAEQVALLGTLTGPAVAAPLASADIAVASAVGGESFGIVLLEAMAARTVVVASDIEGYDGVVTDGVDGVLVPPGDHSALASTLIDLVPDVERQRRLVDAGVRTAAAHDWSVVAAQVLDLYHQARRAGR